MAGTIMHLVIADRLLDKLSIKNPALFYCGNLAPDAIMNRVGYTRDMKRHTHFKDGIRLHEVRQPSCYTTYRARFQKFYEDMVNPSDPQYELYLGYTVHMLVDELYILHYRDQFCDKLIAEGRPVDDETFWPMFAKEVDLVDFELSRTYKFHYPMPDILLTEQNYEIPGWITAKELTDSKNFIIKKTFETEHQDQKLSIMNMEKNLEFIELCVKEIPEMLKKME